MTNRKTAVVLFNLGGPDSPDAVEPFLYNLFKDPAIIRLPGFIRYPLAKLISRKRAPLARQIYDMIGGSSPLLEQTKDQAKALQLSLQDNGSFQVFIVMRYWHPMADEVVQDVKDYDPDQIVLMPLYPQFSTTTTKSSFEDWDRAAISAGLNKTTKRCCCYADQDLFVSAYVNLIAPLYAQALKDGPTRILFSAHGLPEKISNDGDPYAAQVHDSVRAIIEQLGKDTDEKIDHLVCFQSRVGPLKWIGPSTDDAIAEAGQDGVGVLIVPIAFVSEHSETLVELDIEYKELALEKGVRSYIRVPTVGVEKDYIDCLHQLVLDSLNQGQDIHSASKRMCGLSDHGCPNICK